MTRIVFLPLIIGVLAGCSQQPPIQSDVQKAGIVIDTPSHTVKPGPDVMINTALREPVDRGDAGALDVSFFETYKAGELLVSVSLSDGLSAITTDDSTRFDMASTDAHEWTIFFSAEASGRQYVNFHVRVETPFGPLTRSSAAIINVGPENGLQGAEKPQSGELIADADGKQMRVFKATETIVEAN